MSSVSYFKRKDSPFFYIKIYKSKRVEPDPRKRRQNKSTKFPTTREGEKQVKDYVKKINAQLVEKEYQTIFGITPTKKMLLSEGVFDFLENKPKLAKKTIVAYKLAAEHFIAALGNRNIAAYTKRDSPKFLKYMINKGHSKSTQAIFTRHLSAMWNYFVTENFAETNIIVKEKSDKVNADFIPGKDLTTILEYLKSKNLNHYYFTEFLLLTGMRPSSAIIAKWENIYWEEGSMLVRNVKAKRDFYFPLYKDLDELLKKIGIKKHGKIFSYTQTPSFFKVVSKKLFEQEKISRRYTLYQLRNSFASYLANNKVSREIIQKLLNHSDSKITEKHYITYELKTFKKEIERARKRQK